MKKYIDYAADKNVGVEFDGMKFIAIGTGILANETDCQLLLSYDAPNYSVFKKGAEIYIQADRTRHSIDIEDLSKIKDMQLLPFGEVEKILDELTDKPVGRFALYPSVATWKKDVELYYNKIKSNINKI